MHIRSLIKKKPYLIWYTKNFDRLSEGAIVEAILNYGDFEDVRKMLAILGIRKAARIFKEQMGQGRVNYDPKISNYFRLYFEKYARHA